MSNLLSDSSRVILEKLLDGVSDEERTDALAQLATVPDGDKAGICTLLVTRLPKELDVGKRCWSVSALAAINLAGAGDCIAARIDPNQEESEWVRYWAVIGLARMQAGDLKTRLEAALNDPTELVKAVALRLLIENGFEDYIDQLIDMLRQDDNWLARIAACKVLRSSAGHRSLATWIEGKFIPLLAERLTDRYELLDIRFQAALALGDMQHNWQDAIKALRRALDEYLPDWVRRGCVDALRHINRRETKDALLFVLQDKDAEIRVRAANALGQALGTPDAISFVVENLLQQDQLSKEYIDALRQIDNSVAANVLSDRLLHPDPQISTRAAQALALLGGEEAIRTLQAQRTKALDKYTELLGQADTQIMGQFNGLMKRAEMAFSVSMWMHGTIFCIGVVTLLASLYIALGQGTPAFERYIGLGTAAGSLGTLLLLFYQDPLKKIRDSVNGLVKVNVVFLGYVRQINQIDATFKQLFLASAGFGTGQMKETVLQIQASVKQTMEDVKVYLVAG